MSSVQNCGWLESLQSGHKHILLINKCLNHLPKVMFTSNSRILKGGKNNNNEELATLHEH